MTLFTFSKRKTKIKDEPQQTQTGMIVGFKKKNKKIRATAKIESGVVSYNQTRHFTNHKVASIVRMSVRKISQPHGHSARWTPYPWGPIRIVHIRDVPRK